MYIFPMSWSLFPLCFWEVIQPITNSKRNSYSFVPAVCPARWMISAKSCVIVLNLTLTNTTSTVASLSPKLNYMHMAHSKNRRTIQLEKRWSKKCCDIRVLAVENLFMYVLFVYLLLYLFKIFKNNFRVSERMKTLKWMLLGSVFLVQHYGRSLCSPLFSFSASQDSLNNSVWSD